MTVLHELTRTEGYDRVRAHTAPIVNARIDALTDEAIRHAARSPVRRTARLAELDREWDVDRALMANFAILGGASLLLGLRRDRRWLAFFGVQLGFLMMHASVGWCPPLPVFRRLGFRTRPEIDAEHAALRALASDT